MKLKLSASVLAIVAMASGVAYAGDSSTFGASVSVLSPDQTGFIIGGQVAVTGLGSGALTMSRSVADMSLVGKANSSLDKVTATPYLSGVSADSSIVSAMSFDRNIITSGSLVGQGSVTARGEAIAALGSQGAASATTTTAGTRADSVTGPGVETVVTAPTNETSLLGDGVDGLTSVATPVMPGGEGSATADSASQGSLNGSLSTSNTLQLLGTSGLFAGSNGLEVGEQNQAIAYGSSAIDANGTTGVVLNTAAATPGTTAAPTATGNGALFDVTSTLTSPDSQIAMSVSNAGNGTISLTTSTGGFFTGGGAASGDATFVNNGSFFSPTAKTVTTTKVVPYTPYAPD